MRPNLNNVLLTHGRCNDGTMSGAITIAHLNNLVHNPTIHIVYGYYGDQNSEVDMCIEDIKEIGATNFIVTDYSLSVEGFIKILDNCPTLTRFVFADHHASSVETAKVMTGLMAAGTWSNIEEYIIEHDTSICGAQVTAKVFHGAGYVENPLLKYIGDYDLFTKKLPFINEFSVGFTRSYPDPVLLAPVLKEIFENSKEDEFIERMIQIGMPIVDYRNEIIGGWACARNWEANGIDVNDRLFVVIASRKPFINELAEEILKRNPDVSYVIMPSRHKEKTSYALRARAGDKTPHNQIIAEAFGGGGHPSSCGFSVNKNDPETIQRLQDFLRLEYPI